MQTEFYGELATVLSDILQVEISAGESAISRREISEWDSINHLRFALELEEKFGISIKEDEWAEVMSLAEVEELLLRQGIASARQQGREG